MLESWELKIGDVIVTGYKATHVMFRVKKNNKEGQRKRKKNHCIMYFFRFLFTVMQVYKS